MIVTQTTLIRGCLEKLAKSGLVIHTHTVDKHATNHVHLLHQNLIAALFSCYSWN